MKTATEIKEYCINQGVEEHFFNSFIDRIYFYPYKQIKLLEPYKNEKLTKAKLPQFKMLLSCLINFDTNNKKKTEWEKALSLLTSF